MGHGFTGFRAKEDNLRVTSRLAEHLAVLDLDFRGHGESGADSTLGGVTRVTVFEEPKGVKGGGSQLLIPRAEIGRAHV